MPKKEQPGVGGGPMTFVTTEDPLARQLMEAGREATEAAERRARHENTAKLMREFFADPENARLLNVREEDEVPWQDLPHPPSIHPEPTEAELDEAVERVRAEFLHRRK